MNGLSKFHSATGEDALQLPPFSPQIVLALSRPEDR
jgi:hypothetical protein